MIEEEVEVEEEGGEVVTRKYEKFYKNGVIYAFVETPVEFLQTLIPKEAKWGITDQVYDDEGKLTSYTQKIVDDFTIGQVKSIDETKVVFALAAMEAPTFRTKAVTEQDIDDWSYYLNYFKITDDQWLNIEEYQTLINSPAYNTEGE
jgi:hypothetical protein